MVKFTHTILAFRRKRKYYKFQILSYNVKIWHDETGNYKQLRSAESRRNCLLQGYPMPKRKP